MPHAAADLLHFERGLSVTCRQVLVVANQRLHYRTKPLAEPKLSYGRHAVLFHGDGQDVMQ